jgi:hypothetical protein
LRKQKEALELEKTTAWKKSLRGSMRIVPGETALWIPYRVQPPSTGERMRIVLSVDTYRVQPPSTGGGRGRKLLID